MSIEYIIIPNTPVPSVHVRLTSVFIRYYGNQVYRVVKREEIPLLVDCVVTTNFWNIRVINRCENGNVFWSF